MTTEAHGYRVAIYVEHDMLKPLVKKLYLTDYHTNSIKGDSEHVKLVVPTEDAVHAQLVADQALSIAKVLPRLFVGIGAFAGISIEKYALSDGETLDVVWLAA